MFDYYNLYYQFVLIDNRSKEDSIEQLKYLLETHYSFTIAANIVIWKTIGGSNIQQFFKKRENETISKEVAMWKCSTDNKKSS